MPETFFDVIESMWPQCRPESEPAETGLDLFMAVTGLGPAWQATKFIKCAVEHVSGSADNHLPKMELINENEELIDRFESAPGLSKSQLESIRKDLETLQKRVYTDNLDPAEVVYARKEISRMLEPQSGAVLSDEQRARLAVGALHMAAYPYSNDQGQHKTCSVSALESRLYARNPSAAIGVLADLSTSSDSSFRTADNKTVNVDLASLQPDSEAAMNPTIDGDRGYASQVLQVAMVNAAWSGRVSHSEAGTTWTGPFRYTQDHWVTKSDSGERVLDGKNGEVDRAPSLRLSELTGLYEQFSTERTPDFVLVGQERVKTTDGRLVGVASADELLSKIQSGEHNMPLVISVDPAKSPWSGDNPAPPLDADLPLGEEAAAADASARRRDDTATLPAPRPRPTERNPHTVNILGAYRDAETGKWMVQISNHWGSRSDRAVELEQLYRSL